MQEPHVVGYPEDIPKNEREVRKVVWVYGMCGFQARTLDNKFDAFLHTKLFEVIGNIYEKKEGKNDTSASLKY